MFDTKDVLFVSSGAFVGLDEVINRSKNKSSIGIGASIVKTNTPEVLKTVTPDDFVKYGLIPEFVGRHPIIVVFDELTEEMMLKILKEPKNNLISQFKALFDYEGVVLEFEDKYLQNIAQTCLKQKVGARGLRAALERDLQSTQFILPRLAKEGVGKIVIDEQGVPKHIQKVKRKKVNDD